MKPSGLDAGATRCTDGMRGDASDVFLKLPSQINWMSQSEAVLADSPGSHSGRRHDRPWQRLRC